MKCLVIYKSIHHQNTAKIAGAIAEELSASLSSLDDQNSDLLDDYDLIGIGSGIYFGKHHRGLIDFVRRADNLGGKKVFLFYTSGFEKFPTRPVFHEALLSEINKKGAEVVGFFSCRGLETYGPFRIGGGKNKGHPSDADLMEARAFAQDLLKSN
jgi:flavodoxin